MLTRYKFIQLIVGKKIFTLTWVVNKDIGVFTHSIRRARKQKKGNISYFGLWGSPSISRM